jgi:hypothetical protein
MPSSTDLWDRSPRICFGRCWNREFSDFGITFFPLSAALDSRSRNFSGSIAPAYPPRLDAAACHSPSCPQRPLAASAVEAPSRSPRPPAEGDRQTQNSNHARRAAIARRPRIARIAGSQASHRQWQPGPGRAGGRRRHSRRASSDRRRRAGDVASAGRLAAPAATRLPPVARLARGVVGGDHQRHRQRRVEGAQPRRRRSRAIPSRGAVRALCCARSARPPRAVPGGRRRRLGRQPAPCSSSYALGCKPSPACRSVAGAGWTPRQRRRQWPSPHRRRHRQGPATRRDTPGPHTRRAKTAAAQKQPPPRGSRRSPAGARPPRY